jgi:hypothetical protein
MYGDKFGKSLCHAWGASPIYLLGRYFLGIRPVTQGYSTFECTPDLGGLDWMEGTVPVPGGQVTVYMDKNVIKIKSDVEDGILVWNGKRIPLPASEIILDI